MVPQEKPDIVRRKLAVALGVSLEQVNYCIKALGDKVYVKVGNLRPARTSLDMPACSRQQALPRIQGSPPHPLRVSWTRTMRHTTRLTRWRSAGDVELDQFGGAFW
jgi:hypothetical protein